jgi:hypothetical protein
LNLLKDKTNRKGKEVGGYKNIFLERFGFRNVLSLSKFKDNLKHGRVNRLGMSKYLGKNKLHECNFCDELLLKQQLDNHIFTVHLDELGIEINKYLELNLNTFSAPFSINKKGFLYYCLCCKGTWDTKGRAIAHQVKSPNCTPENQLKEIHILAGKTAIKNIPLVAPKATETTDRLKCIELRKELDACYKLMGTMKSKEPVQTTECGDDCEGYQEFFKLNKKYMELEEKLEEKLKEKDSIIDKLYAKIDKLQARNEKLQVLNDNLNAIKL